MKKFVELIQRVHQERFSVVRNKILAEKIPVAFLSLAPINNAIQTVNKLREQGGVNIKTLITLDAPPPQSNFDVVHINDALKIRPRPEYILVVDDISARVAIKYLPYCQTISFYSDWYNVRDSEKVYQIFMTHLKELQEVYESFIDEESRKVFCGYWLGKISNKFGEYVFSRNVQYIMPGFIPERGAILMEGGVFNGTTSAFFSDMGYKVYAFELDKTSYERSKKLAEEKNVVLENIGLGSFDGTLRYNENGDVGNRWNLNGKNSAPVITLDTYVLKNKIPHVDFIKLDVEGAEYDTLSGAKTILSRWKPILAISAYHKLDDFWSLTNLIKSIRPDYEFALRQFAQPSCGEGAAHLYSLGLHPEDRNFNECVLFAR